MKGGEIMQLTVIEGAVRILVEVVRTPGDIVTIQDPKFSTVSISGVLIQLPSNGMATIKDPCGTGIVSGKYIPLMIREK
jgi:hypothetical protein